MLSQNDTLAILLGLLSLVAQCMASIHPISIQGSHFFDANGTQFIIRGIGYQDMGGATPESAEFSTPFIDLLADQTRCLRDIPYLQKLGVNVIYATTIDTRQDHSRCMRALEEAGISVLVEFANQGPNLPGAVYNNDRYIYLDYNVYDYFVAVIDEFQKYPNTLGFFHVGEDKFKAGFQSITWKMASIRDNKAYMRRKGYRQIPIGVGLVHHEITQLASFLNCGDRDDAVDFTFFDFNFEQDSQCPDPTSWANKDMISQYRDYGIPLFYLYGCNKDLRRNFDEVPTLYRNESLEVFSGGVVFEYFENWINGADFGLVDAKGSSVTPRPAFSALASRLAAVTPAAKQLAAYTPTHTPTPCPSVMNLAYKLVPNREDATQDVQRVLPEQPNRRLCACMLETVSCTLAPGTNPYSILRNPGPRLCDAIEGRCKGVEKNITTGEYGAYFSCTSAEKAAWVLDKHVEATGNASECAARGGVPKTPTGEAAQAGDCRALLSQAGRDGTGIVRAVANDTEPSTSTHASAPAGLSYPAKMGLAIGLTALLLLAIIGAVLLLRKRARRKRKDARAVAYDFGKAELAADESPTREKGLADATPVAEMSGESAFAELAGGKSGKVVELSAQENEKIELSAHNEGLFYELDGSSPHELYTSPVAKSKQEIAWPDTNGGALPQKLTVTTTTTEKLEKIETEDEIQSSPEKKNGPES